MFRFPSSNALVIVALCAGLAATTSFVRCANAEPRDIVDLEGDTHNKPPASTTDKSTPKPGKVTDSKTPVTKEAKDIKDAAKQEVAAEKLKLRAGERVGNSARGSAQVLGMSLQEGTHQRVKVVDVAMNSPAFDAGVMKGDEILAFQGFRGESYRKWIDGIRRLTTDTGAGLKIPVVVNRDGKQVSVGIVVPEKPVRPSIPRALAQPGSPLIPPGASPASAGGPGAPVAIAGGNNVAIDNGGPFGEFFAGQASANESAMAQIVRIGGQPSPNPSPAPAARAAAGGNQSQTTPTAAPINGGARIGMAGFRDDPSGMVVMVDVGALPPGNYTVAVTDPSVLGGAGVTGAGAVNPNVQSPSQLAPEVPVPAPNSGRNLVPSGAAPTPAGTRQPQGNLPPSSNRSIPRTILAQVAETAEPTTTDSGLGTAADSIPPTGEVSPSTIPPTGQVNPSTIPPTGEVFPSTSTPTGKSKVNEAQRAQMAKDAAGTGSGATLNQIGTITVDQSGTGRMQQKVESVQVRNLVGQAIVLYSQGGSPQTTLPANLNGSAGTATPQGVVDSPASSGSPRANNANGGQGSAAAQTAAQQPATSGSQVPVAGGVIQLVTDRRPPATTAPQTSQAPAGTNDAGGQPAIATPPAGQNLVR